MRERIALLLSLGLGLGLAMACGSSSHAPGEDGGGGASSSQDAPYCPSTLFSLVTCGGESIGTTCPGTVNCPCGGTGVELPTSCTCQEDDLGASWYCEDDCSNACTSGSGGGSAGSGGAPAATTCESIFLAEAPCVGQPPPSEADLQAECAMVEQQCGQIWDAFVTCAGTSHLECDDGLPSFPGCDDQALALRGCLM